jgi:iron complex outermembrane receptor protein
VTVCILRAYRDLALDKEQAIKLSTTLQKKWTAFSVEVNPFINSIRNFMFLRPIDFETTTRGASLFGNTSRPMQD